MSTQGSSSIRFDKLKFPLAASLGLFTPRLEPIFEVIRKHSAALTVDFMGAPEDFLNPQSIACSRIVRAFLLRFESIVHFFL